MGARKHTGWKDIAELPLEEQYKWADQRLAGIKQGKTAITKPTVSKRERLPKDHMRGLFGVWWYKGVRFEKNFLGKYIIQDFQEFSDMDRVLDYIDRREKAMVADMERFGTCWPIRDPCGWPALKESEPEQKPIEVAFWVVLVTLFLIGTICGWLMF